MITQVLQISIYIHLEKNAKDIVGISQGFSLPQTIWKDVPIDCVSCTSMASAVHSNTSSDVITPSS